MDGGHWSEEARQVGVPELPEWSLGRQQTSVASQHGPKAGSSGLKCKCSAPQLIIPQILADNISLIYLEQLPDV